jgi:hypothetical protein
LMYPGKCWHIPPLKVLKKRAVSNINLWITIQLWF